MVDFVSRPKFEEYREQFKEFFVMERRNGIIMLRMHTEGGPVRWTWQAHNAVGQAWHVIGNDPENEVMILTATGPHWVGYLDADMKAMDKRGKVGYDYTMYDACKLVENLVFDLDIPTIGAVTGPGIHTEMGLFCDITLCSEQAEFSDPHFLGGEVPGDGQGLSLQGLIGIKRAAYCMYTGQRIDARTALELGLVNEVLPMDKLLPRAWEIAEEIMRAPRVARRMTSQLIKRPWQRLIMNDFRMQMAYEFYAHKEEKATWGSAPIPTWGEDK
ncbi:MAG: enoyl-CoA hydratase/isomerase family protein [Chloroflexota bacterium]